MNIAQLDKWHKTKAGLLAFAFVEFALAFLFGRLALNSGSIWQWVLLMLFGFGALQNFLKMVWVHKK